MRNEEYNTEHSISERYDNFDNIVLGITDRREGERFYFVVVLYNNKFDFIGCFDIIYTVGLDSKSITFYWRGACEQIENLVFPTFTKKSVTRFLLQDI